MSKTNEKRIRFLIFNQPPGSKGMTYKWPLWLSDDGVLYLANLNGRKNGFCKPTVFKTREEAKKAIQSTKKWVKDNEAMWNDEYIIQPIAI